MTKIKKIACVQFLPKPGDIDHNLKKISLLVAKAAKAGADIVLLPEICEFGYDIPSIKRSASSSPNKTSRRLSSLAKEHNINIVAGVAEKRGKHIFNSAFIFNRKGRLTGKYDKTHLCGLHPFNEPKVFTKGKKIMVTALDGLKIGISICFDIRFPELYRKMALLGAQLVLHPTAFPFIRIDQFEACIKARAIENQFFIAGANYCGTPGRLKMGGTSLILGLNGETLAKASISKEEIIYADIDVSQVKAIRKERPVFLARRTDLYGE